MNIHLVTGIALMAATALLGLNGCKPSMENQGAPNPSPKSGATTPETMMTETARAELTPTQGNDVRGTVMFTKEAGGIRVVAELTGLAPGKHGFHIHDKGDCSAPDGSSAGGHFNPTNMPHAGPDAEKRHVGDLGNIEADSTGKAHYDRVDAHLSFDGTTSILGRSVIVHGGEDDFVSQPSGNAGPRVACGVIQKP